MPSYRMLNLRRRRIGLQALSERDKLNYNRKGPVGKLEALATLARISFIDKHQERTKGESNVTRMHDDNQLLQI